jgi:hypothetical protein
MVASALLTLFIFKSKKNSGLGIFGPNCEVFQGPNGFYGPKISCPMLAYTKINLRVGRDLKNALVTFSGTFGCFSAQVWYLSTFE